MTPARNRIHRFAAVAAAALLCLAAPPLQATTYVVTDAGDSGPGTLRGQVAQAIADAGEGHEIAFAPGIAAITLASGEILITESMTLDGGAGVTITTDGASRAFRLSGNVKVWNFSSFVFTNCAAVGAADAGRGGALAHHGSEFRSHIAFENCAFSNNFASVDGGAIRLNSNSRSDAEGSLTLKNCRFENNVAGTGSGGAIKAGSGTVKMESTTFLRNTAQSAGALQTEGTYAWTNVWRNVVFRENAATNVAGAIYMRGGVRLWAEDVRFVGNSSTNDGGAVYLQYWSTGVLQPEDTVFTNCLFVGNRTVASSKAGGAIQTSGGGTWFADCTFATNSATQYGGAIRTSDSTYDDPNIVLDNCRFFDNEAGVSGGAIYHGYRNCRLTVRNNTRFWRNRASGGTDQGGGAIFSLWDASNPSYLTIENAAFHDNASSNAGGALRINSLISMSDSTLSNNVAAGDGGGAYLSLPGGREIEMSNCLFANNTANGGNGGGGIYQRGSALFQVVGSTFIGNQASSGPGGGIHQQYDSPVFTASNCTFVANTAVQGGGTALSGGSSSFPRGYYHGCTMVSNIATKAGGGLFFEGHLPAYTGAVVNCTIAYNQAPEGGGIRVSRVKANDQLAILNSTLFGNSTADGNGGGIYIVDSEGVELESTIVYGNSVGGAGTGPDLRDGSQVFKRVDHCLVGDIAGWTAASGGDNLLGVDPKLGPLADNGGPTATLALSRWSPARDVGTNPLGLATDQRGADFTRVYGDAPDIGAYEYIPPPPLCTIVIMR